MAAAGSSGHNVLSVAIGLLSGEGRGKCWVWLVGGIPIAWGQGFWQETRFPRRLSSQDAEGAELVDMLVLVNQSQAWALGCCASATRAAHKDGAQTIALSLSK